MYVCEYMPRILQKQNLTNKLYLPLFRDISLWFPITTKTLKVLKSCEFKWATPYPV